MNAGVIREALRELTGKRLLVVGDTILDRYLFSEPRGVSLEAPLLVWDVVHECVWPGGAALVAAAAAKWGLKVDLCTSVWDEDLERLISLLPEGVVVKPTGRQPLVEKTRVIHNRNKVHKHQRVRGDWGSFGTSAPIGLADNPDGIVLLDFGGLSRGDREATLTKQSVSEAPMAVDKQFRLNGTALNTSRCAVCAPTLKEVGGELSVRQSLSILKAGGFEGYRAVTLGRRGSAICGNTDKHYWLLPSLQARAVDPVGAGDHYLLGLLMAHMAGLSVVQAGLLASAMAAVACGQIGNPAVEPESVYQCMLGREEFYGRELKRKDF
jgi:D-beta-D-heptose 7-phosphate kinase/D-beta-D-heptose 1-phosphate adenosyltransferase